MAIRLEKGQRINLEKESGTKLTNFCVGCNWGAIIKKTFFGLSTSVVDVDLDLSCMMLPGLYGRNIQKSYLWKM